MKNRYSVRTVFIGLVLLCLVFRWVALGEDETIVWIEGKAFDIIGTDNRSASFANALGEHVAEMCQRYLKVGSHDFQGRILVTLLPKEHVCFKEDYQIQISPRGQVSLDICWDDLLSFETTCRAFTEAYLQRYARFNYGVGANKRIRYWVASALFSQVYLSLRPAQKIRYIRTSERSEMLEIWPLLSISLSEVSDETLDWYQGYWLLQILRESGLTYRQLTQLFDRAIAGIDIMDELLKIVFPEDKEKSEDSLGTWWHDRLRDYLTREHEFFDSLQTSRSWIESMENFDAYLASGGHLNDLMELWTYRHDEALRSILSARCEIIRLRIERVNPAYFNTALSMGALYETVLEAENKHEFVSAVVTYLNDWEDTKRLHARVDELLSACD